MSKNDSSWPFQFEKATSRWLQEFVPQGIFATDAELRILSWNRWLSERSGIRTQDAVGEHLLTLFPTLKKRGFVRYYETVLKGQAHFLSQRLHEYLLPMLPSLNHLPVKQMLQSVHLTPLYENDVVIGTMTVIEDVTERVVREQELQASERRYRSLFDGVPIGLYRTAVDGRIIDINQALVQMLGYPDKETLLAKNVRDLYVETHTRQEWQAQMALVEDVYHQVDKYRRYDGSVLWTEDVARAIRDENGTILFYDGSLQDITDRKEAEIALQRREQELKSIVAHLPEGVLLLDQIYRIMLANPAAEAALPLLVAPGTESLSRIGDVNLDQLHHSSEFGRPWHEIRSLKGDRLFEITAVPLLIENAGTHSGCVVVLRDVTEARQQQAFQASQERLATVGQLAAGIAHDFNNIMSAIVLYSQLLSSSLNLNSKQERHIKTVIQQAHRAADLVSQILDFSRVSVMDREVIDILPFLKELHKLLLRTFPETITIKLVPHEQTYMVNIDPTRLQQVMMNLALNARDAMPEGGCFTITLSRLTLEPDQGVPVPGIEVGQWLKLMVSDTGTGIPASDLPHIFEPFFTTKPPGQGTGLGLAQVYGIIKQHDGHIDVVSRSAEGTTFSIYLPLIDQPQAAPLPHSQPLTQGTGETILVVEDSPPTRLALCEILEATGYRTLAAKNGQEALTLFGKHADQIQLVISDLVMPVMGGEALLGILKEQAPSVKMVLMTGYPKEANRTILEQGTITWMEKPFTIDQVLTAVSQALDHTAESSRDH